MTRAGRARKASGAEFCQGLGEVAGSYLCIARLLRLPLVIFCLICSFIVVFTGVLAPATQLLYPNQGGECCSKGGLGGHSKKAYRVQAFPSCLQL